MPSMMASSAVSTASRNWLSKNTHRRPMCAVARLSGESFSPPRRQLAQAWISVSCPGQGMPVTFACSTRLSSELEGGKLDRHTFLRYLEYWFEQHITDFDKRRRPPQDVRRVPDPA